MADIATDVVDGFNEFLATQRRLPGRVRITLAQFDSEDPFEVLIDGVDLREVSDIDRHAYQPRGSTPRYAAVGRMIAKMDAEVAARAANELEEEDQVVVIITDGLENASTEHTRASVFQMITERRKLGWVFVFLGADQDSYAESRNMAISQYNSASWEKSAAGTKEMWKDLSSSTKAYLAKQRMARRADADRFYFPDYPGNEQED